MNHLDSSEFQFETKVVNIPKLKRNPKCKFRIPVPTGHPNNNLASDLDPTHPNSSDSNLTENQHSVNVRPPFKNLIERNIEHIEKLYDVRMSLQEVEGEYKLISSGVKAEPSISEMLNICRKSNVYNFYLCFPVRGEEFHKKFGEFKKGVQYKLGGSVSFERRPHITLALVNLVTDSDIDTVVRALQLTSLTIKSVPKSNIKSGFEDYAIDLEGLDVVKYKGKMAKRSVLMSNVTLSETLSDIANEFQNSLNKSVNTLISSNQKRRKISRSDRIANLTEAQLAPKGIFLTRGGNIEITFTDVPLVDPKASVKREGQGEDERDRLESSQKWDDNYESGDNSKDNDRYNASGSVGHIGHSEMDVIPGGKEGEGVQEEEDEEVYEYNTAVKNKFHVTLMRHEQVSVLSSLKFESKGHVVCVELRPRNGECCNFMAYNINELVSFVGNRFDNKEKEDIATSQISGSQAPKIPNHLLVDAETEARDGSEERFVFWIN